MGLMKGTLSARRYCVEKEIDFARIEEGLNDQAFREPLSPTHKEAQHGWAIHENPLHTDFSAYLGDWRSDATGCAVFVLRTDKKTIPGNILKAHLKERCEAWCRSNQRERVPSAVKAELKEALELELLQQTMAKMRTVEILWNVREKWVLVGCNSEATLDTIRKFFHRSFGLVLTSEAPLTWAEQPGLVRALMGVSSPDFRAGVTDEERELVVDSLDVAPLGEDESGEIPPGLLSTFLVWAWWKCEDEPNTLVIAGKQASTWIDDRIAFRSPGEDKTTVLVATDNSGAAKEARIALEEGKVPKELRLNVRLDDREYLFTVSGPTLEISGAKLPAVVVGGDSDEILLDRVASYEEVHGIVRDLFLAFCDERVASTWPRTVRNIRAWIGSAS